MFLSVCFYLVSLIDLILDKLELIINEQIIDFTNLSIYKCRRYFRFKLKVHDFNIFTLSNHNYFRILSSNVSQSSREFIFLT